MKRKKACLRRVRVEIRDRDGSKRVATWICGFACRDHAGECGMFREDGRTPSGIVGKWGRCDARPPKLSIEIPTLAGEPWGADDHR